ncbi:capsular biosynthesis protein [Shewanella sp. SW24]|uniref:capsular biosynthesis protein n=1 Tax=Shewanella sp. SW24 TaxID=2912815 RepID=UPI0021D8087A|nr:capsular biosynthesis protein [Shewanella sp. SW24]MCU7987573.1 capsular biosynthesis protein [Shewanella sp. SW24]
MILIMSSALIESELQSEFGPIPPAFLPVGNKRLFEQQVASLPKNEDVVLTLSEEYQLEHHDQNRLESLGVEVLRLPSGLSLGEAVLYAINLLALPEEEGLKLLHGDTLFSQLPKGLDLVSLSEVADAYDWAIYQDASTTLLGSFNPDQEDISTWVASGYFAFSKPRELSRALTESRFGFIDAVNLYHQRVGLNPIKIDQWLDFGHVHTYYRSKSKMTTQRAFNQMIITSRTVTKKSYKSEKMKAEANWFKKLPPEIKSFTPQLLDVLDADDAVGYQIEYLHLTALNELFTFGELPPFVWRRILLACLDFVDSCIEYLAPRDINVAKMSSLFGVKTEQRLQEYAIQTELNLDTPWVFNGQTLPGLRQILSKVDNYLPNTNTVATWYHGDLCFSNILFDFRTGSVKVIDPRGITPEGEISPYGDIRYDIAKLSHSVIGRYDVIIAGYFKLVWQPYNVEISLAKSSRMDSIETYFTRLIEQRYGLNKANLLAMQVHLFLSMLPLHSDNPKRQQALMANALRLFSKLEEF